MFYVYILKSLAKEWIYVGYTSDLKKRLLQHQNGESLATKPYRPFELVFYEAYKSSNDAKGRERYFKTTKGKRSLRLLLTESLK